MACPTLGVKGAAYATVIGQIISAAMVIFFHLKLNVEIENKLKYFKPRLLIINEIYTIGLPAIISQALLTVTTYGLNVILGQLPKIGENAVAIYGLYCKKIQQMILFAAIGIRDTITPIISFNFGKKNKKRVKEAIYYGIFFTAVLMVIGLIGVEAAAVPLTRFFSLSETSYRMCIDCIRIVSLTFIFAGLSTAFQDVFQAIECGLESLLISLGRQIIFLLPVAWAIGKFITGPENVSMIWWSFFVAEFLTLLSTVFMYKHAIKKKLDKWESKL